MTTGRHLSTEELEQGLDSIHRSPNDQGLLGLIVRRSEVDQRESLATGYLDVSEGLVGDNWKKRGSRHMPDGEADPDMQLNIMNSRVAELVANGLQRRELAGDQLYLDMDLSKDNLPTGTPAFPRRSDHRGYRTATHRLQEICRSLWPRRNGFRQFRRRQNAELSRYLRQGHSVRRHPDRRCRSQGLINGKGTTKKRASHAQAAYAGRAGEGRAG